MQPDEISDEFQISSNLTNWFFIQTASYFQSSIVRILWYTKFEFKTLFIKKVLFQIVILCFYCKEMGMKKSEFTAKTINYFVLGALSTVKLI